MEDELLAAILADPADDAPRLVYGDWLLGQADETVRARGELIHVQCTRARMPDVASPEMTALVRREAEILRRHTRAWLDAAVPAGLGPHRRGTLDGAEWRFERGFAADGARGRGFEPYELAAHLPALLATTPIARLKMRCYRDGDLADLVALPGLEQLETLRLDIALAATTASLAPLLACTRFTRLTDLQFEWSNAGSAPPLDALLAAPIATRLEHLAISWYQAPAEKRDFRALVASVIRAPIRARLISLQLTGDMLGAQACAALCEAAWPRLRALTLEVDDVGIATPALARAPALAALESVTLALRYGRILEWKIADVIDLVRALPHLHALALRDQDPMPDLTAFLALEELGRLRALALNGCSLDADAARAIAKAPHLRGLRVLDLAANNLGKAGAEALAKSPQLATLRSLDLSNNGRTGVTAFTKSKHLDGLAHLGLRRNQIPQNAAVDALRDRFGAAPLIAEDD